MFSIKQSVATTILNQLVSAAGSGAKIVIYDGNIPSSADAGLNNNFALATFACPNPIGTVSGRVLTFATLTANQAVDHPGTATFFRVLTSGNSVVAQGTVTASGGNGNLKLSSITLPEGGSVTINSANITLG